MEDLSAFSARPRLAALLGHFAKVKDARQACKVMYPLKTIRRKSSFTGFAVSEYHRAGRVYEGQRPRRPSSAPLSQLGEN
jgi:hypothetical protein